MMKKFIVAIALTAALLPSCKQQNNSNDTLTQTTKVEGGKYYGGIIRINEAEYFKNLYPHSMVGAISARIASQVYEGLFKFDQTTLELKKSLCEDYTISDNNLVYTFKIKKGVKFHDDDCFSKGEGRELTAEDFKYCFSLLCTQDKANKGFYIFDGTILGARKYYDASVSGTPNFDIEGIKVIDTHTLQITLQRPSSLFLYDMARPFTFVFPKEAREKYGLDMRIKAVGTGPFLMSDVEENVSVNLKRNKNYHAKDEYGNQLPFLSGINIRFIKDKKQELFEFKKGGLDMIYRLPTEHIIEILQAAHSENGEFNDYEVQRDPEMTTNFLGFQMNDPVFKDINVRKAFSFAIDREKILEYVLNGEGYEPGFYGITPPTYKDYDVRKIKGYTINIDSAKYYLKLAGYPDGKGFPDKTLDVNPGAERNINVAIEVQKQLKDNLNIDIEINRVPFATHVENMQKGKSSFFRTAWRADIPVAENFLSVLYGKDIPATMEEESYPNIMRYNNEKFNALYEKGLEAPTMEEANKYFMQAEQIAINDAPFLAVWYDEGFRLLQSYVKDFPNNPMQYRDFSAVYIEQINKIPEEDGKKGN